MNAKSKTVSPQGLPETGKYLIISGINHEFMTDITTTYFGYITNDPDEAAKDYEARCGFKPTIIIARPEFNLTREHPLIVRSVFGIYAGLLLSHVVKPKDIPEKKNGLPVLHKGERLERISKEEKAPEKNKRGRPSQNGGLCPHCGELITDFSELGYWYGWAYGIEPPYWPALRLYVFRRDDFTCKVCRKRLPISHLVAHHIIPKEIQGHDSSRNLVTMCHECHADEHPIFPDEDNSGS